MTFLALAAKASFVHVILHMTTEATARQRVA